MKTLYTLSAILILCSLSFSQTTEYYFRLKIQDISEIDQLTRMVSVDKLDDGYVYAYANDREWIEINATDYEIERLPHPSSLYAPKMAETLEEMGNWDSYPTYPLYLQMMQQYADSFPEICRLDTFGYSVQGRLLLAIKISDNVDAEEDEPEFFYTSSMHGDELVGYVLMLRLIDYLLHQYGQTTPEGIRATHMIDNMEIWINPLANPDGTYRNANQTVYNAWRGNADGVDLNRDFPDRINDPVNTPFGREPETQAMMALAAANNFSLSANFHGGAQVANYPWDNGAPSGSYSACPDDAWFIDVATTYASTNPDLLNGGFTNGITNGCDWYAIFGGRQDWIYYWHGGRELTIELSNVKLDSAYHLPTRWANNKESLLSYMEQTFKGVRGLVTDAATGEPLWAQIDVQGYAEVPVFTDPDVGDYHRLLLPGTYTLYVRSPYHYSDTLYNVSVMDSGATRVNVALPKLPTNHIAGQAVLTDTSYYGGVKVQIQEQSVYTNASGYFQLEGIYAGELAIHFSKPGYFQITLDTSFSALEPLLVEVEMGPSQYQVLLIDDDGGERARMSGKKQGGEKGNLPWEKIFAAGQSADIIQTALNSSGYEVVREHSSQTDPAAWQNYDLLFWSSGADLSPIGTSALQNAIINYGQSNGPLIVEGGEIGYKFRNNSSMKDNILHFSDWQADNAGSLVVQNPSHPITQGLPTMIPLNYSGNYGDQDAVTLAPGSQLLLENSNRPATAGLLINGQHLFYAFNLAALNQADASQLALNSAKYFLPLLPDTHDVALYGINGLSSGDMIQSGSSVPLNVTLKNYGMAPEPPGIPVEISIKDDGDNVLHSAQASTDDTLNAGDEMQVGLGDWTAPDTTANLWVKAAVQLSGDQRSGNDARTVQITSLSLKVNFSEDFEAAADSLLWKIVSVGDSSVENWHLTHLPALGRYAMRVNPDSTSIVQEEWLISPPISNAAELFFYWDYGADQIQDALLILSSSTTDSLAEFTDTVMTITPDYPDSVNHFHKLNKAALVPDAQYIAFVYKGNGGHYWALDNIGVSSSPTGIADQPGGIPGDYALLPNYPNPFNPSTTVRYSLPKATEVRIVIYNILGQRVRRLVDEHRNAGVHQIQWDGRNDSGGQAASGIYFYRMETSDFSISRKMLLVR